MHVDESFRPQLTGLSINGFEQSGDVTYIVDTDMCLRGYNEAWRNFAASNGGSAVLTQYPLGRSILDGMSPKARAFYAAAYLGALANKARFDQCFECSSASVFRCFQQSAYPLTTGSGLVVTNHLVEDRPIDRHRREPSQVYLNADGLVTQCCHCRRVADQTILNKWDWVPLWVECCPPATSHTFCPACADFYYPRGRVPPPGTDALVYNVE